MLISEFSFPQKEEPICEGVYAGERLGGRSTGRWEATTMFVIC